MSKSYLTGVYRQQTGTNLQVCCPGDLSSLPQVSGVHQVPLKINSSSVERSPEQRRRAAASLVLISPGASSELLHTSHTDVWDSSGSAVGFPDSPGPSLSHSPHTTPGWVWDLDEWEIKKV